MGRQRVGRLRVLRLERRRHHVAGHAGADPELSQLSDGECRRAPLERAWERRRQRDRAERARVFVFLRVKVAVHPSVVRALDARRAALHVVLRVEVRARLIVRSTCVHDGELAALEVRLERRHARMQPEEPVEIDGTVLLVRFLNRDRRTRAVVGLLAERHDHVQAVDGAALKDGDEHFLARLRRFGGARDEGGREPETHEREAAVLEENASGHHDKCSCQANGRWPQAKVLSVDVSGSRALLRPSAYGLWPECYRR